MKVVNWVFGSFFRTIGRTIALFVMAGIIYYLLASSGIDLKNLFLEDLKASSVVGDGVGNGYFYFESSDSFLTSELSSYTWVQYSNDDLQRKRVTFNNFIPSASSDYVEFNVLFSQPIQTASTNSETGRYCTRWDCMQYCSSGSCAGMCEQYNCMTYSNYTSGSDTTVYSNGFTDMQVLPIITYHEGGWASCSMNGNTITCPTNGKNIDFIDFDILFKTSTTTNLKVSVSRTVTFFKSSTSQIIDNQNQNTQSIINQQQNSTQQMLDSNTTQAESEASDFFGNFTQSDHGGLNSIVTAPLNTINSLLTNSCTNLVLPLPFVNENITLPCMNDIYTTHFGLFFSLYQTIILAIISYRCIRSIFFDIHGFTDPDDDRIEVMDL